MLKIGNEVTWGKEIVRQGVVVAVLRSGERPCVIDKSPAVRCRKIKTWCLAESVISGLKTLKIPVHKTNKTQLYNRDSVRNETSYIVFAPDTGNLYWPKTSLLNACK